MRSFLLFLPAVFLAACSASAVAPEAGTSEAEITTVDASTCPRELRLHIGYGMAWADTDAAAVGLDKAEVERLDAAVSELAALSSGPIVIDAGNPVTTASTCTYAQASSTTAELRTSTAGDPELEITTGHLRLVAHPKRFAPEGIRFSEDTMVDVLAVVSDPKAKGPAKLAEIGSVAVDVTGEQIARYPGLSALRVPVLQKSLAPLAQHHASYRETMVIDTEKGPDKYMRYAESIQSSLDIELLSHADPIAFRTTDPDTTICFLGPAAGVCELAGRFSNKVFSDGFEGCTATESEITMTFRAASMVVPRCQ